MTIFADTEELEAWRAHLETVSAPDRKVTLPIGHAQESVLRYLDIPQEDIPDVIGLAPTPEHDPEVWWYLERAVWSLVPFMGHRDSPPRFAALRDINDPNFRFFYVHVLVAALPYVQEYHRKIGISEDVAQATLADVGRNVRVHRKREGVGGLGVAWWLMLHFRGIIYQLDRLQFERTYMREDIAQSVRASGRDVHDKTSVLSIHIPDFMGPMSPEACDAAITQAREFFPRYFPDDPVDYAICHSWLLDPQLKDYLRPESNIIRFQDRFTLGEGQWNSNAGIMQFVFGRTPKHIDTVPQTTSLERSVVKHLANGGTWYGRGGWFRLDEEK